MSRPGGRRSSSLRDALAALFPDAVAEAAAEKAAAEQANRAERLARYSRVPHTASTPETRTKPTGKPGVIAAGQAIRLSRSEGGNAIGRANCTADLKLPGTLDATQTPEGHSKHWKAPPSPLRAIPEGAIDLTGVRFGRMVVISYYDGGGGKGALWLVRCACGDYELCRTRTVTRGPEDHCCRECDRVRRIREAGARKDSRMRRAQDVDRLEAIAKTGGKVPSSTRQLVRPADGEVVRRD